MFLNIFRDRRLVVAILIVVSMFTLGVQLLNPPELVVAGDDATAVETVGYYFTYRDVVIVAISAAVFGASAVYLTLDTRYSSDKAGNDPETEATDCSVTGVDTVDKEDRRDRWEETAARLADTEQVVYEAVMEAGGEIPQQQIVERTDLSKATVSRTLKNLESRELLNRERRGMGNVVVLQYSEARPVQSARGPRN